MPRKLPPNGATEFLEHYQVGTSCKDCGSQDFSVVVYDSYGTMPKDESDPAAQRGVGDFVAAFVVCEGCGKSSIVDRAQLSAHQAAE